MSQSSAKERILGAGLRVACRAGLCGVTYGAVSRDAGISKSGIVAHFSSSERLKAAIIYSAHDVCEGICGATGAGATGSLELREYLSRWLGWTRRAGLPGSCPIASGLCTCCAEGALVRESLRRADSKWQLALVALINHSAARDQLPRDVDAPQLAWNLRGAYLSHHVARHCLTAPDAARRSSQAIDDLLLGARRRS